MTRILDLGPVRTLTDLEAKTALVIFRERRAAIVRMFEDSADADAYDRAHGHRAHHCVHGTNQWTDYDNICGPCEDGLTTVEDYLPILRANAISSARRYLADMHALTDALMALAKLNVGDHMDVSAALDVIHARAGITRHGRRPHSV